MAEIDQAATIDGEPLLDQGFAALYLNDQTEYGGDPALATQPREEMADPRRPDPLRWRPRRHRRAAVGLA